MLTTDELQEMFDTKEEAIAAYISTIKPIRNEYLRSAI
jgi:hypothetical protein